ncbi:MAG: GNAT family N-acetyltransferase [Deltaproteobacteria bacterium]|nr:GNAT family N-acetyltransferase [Deltaproteobacteria bacterium]
MKASLMRESMRNKEICIDGEHIYLRKVRNSDVNDKYWSWMNDTEVTKLTVSRGKKYSKKEIKDYVKEKLEDDNTLFLAIVLIHNDQHIGNIKLGPIDWDLGVGDLGLIIGEKDYWGKGYGSEAIGLICRYAFEELNLKKVTAGYFAGNKGSFKAFNNNGFRITNTTQEKYPGEKDSVEVTWMALGNPKLSLKV